MFDCSFTLSVCLQFVSWMERTHIGLHLLPAACPCGLVCVLQWMGRVKLRTTKTDYKDGSGHGTRSFPETSGGGKANDDSGSLQQLRSITNREKRHLFSAVFSEAPVSRFGSP